MLSNCKNTSNVEYVLSLTTSVFTSVGSTKVAIKNQFRFSWESFIFFFDKTIFVTKCIKAKTRSSPKQITVFPCDPLPPAAFALSTNTFELKVDSNYTEKVEYKNVFCVHTSVHAHSVFCLN